MQPCNRELPKANFSGKQWQSKQHERRCKSCIEANNKAVQKKVPLRNYIDEEEARAKVAALPDKDDVSCWICLDEVDDDAGQPLVRDCSCRGNAGFAHVSCLAEYAKTKSLPIFFSGEFNPDELYANWKICPNCNQEYLKELLADMATSYVQFTQDLIANEASDLPCKQWLHLEALNHKLRSLENIFSTSCIEDGKQLANKILSMLGQIKGQYPTSFEDAPEIIPELRRLQLEAESYIGLGHFSYDEGTGEGVKAAIKYYKMARQICGGMDGCTDMTIGTQRSIDFAQTFLDEFGKEKSDGFISRKWMSGSAEDIQERLKIHRQIYKRALKKGESSPFAITEGCHLADNLHSAGYGVEAQRLITTLAAVCKQVHGPDHEFTERVNESLREIKLRQVSLGTMFQWHHYVALEYNEKTDKYVVLGPTNTQHMLRPDEEMPPHKAAERLVVGINDVLLDSGMPVMCRGLTHPQEHLNGKIGDITAFAIGDIAVKMNASGYTVRFEDTSLGEQMMRPENIRLLFDLPDVVEEVYI